MKLAALWFPIVASAFLRCQPAESPLTQAEGLLAAFMDKKPVSQLGPGMTANQARDTQREFVALLEPKLGRRVGFKVGLTSKAVQEMMGATEPVSGVLLEKMILQDGAKVSARFAARPVYEADMVAVVKDAGLNEATTPMEALQHLSHFAAFIELPDRFVAESVKTDGNLVTAINVSARLGVLGERIIVEPNTGFLEALAAMRVTAKDQNGNSLIEAKGEALLGNPVNSVLWLVKDLKATGRRLKAGDLISLGSFARPLEPKPGLSVTVTYEGVPGGPFKATVHFVD